MEMVGTPADFLGLLEPNAPPFNNEKMEMAPEPMKVKKEKYRKAVEACAFLQRSLEPWVILLLSK